MRLGVVAAAAAVAGRVSALFLFFVYWFLVLWFLVYLSPVVRRLTTGGETLSPRVGIPPVKLVEIDPPDLLAPPRGARTVPCSGREAAARIEEVQDE